MKKDLPFCYPWLWSYWLGPPQGGGGGLKWFVKHATRLKSFVFFLITSCVFLHLWIFLWSSLCICLIRQWPQTISLCACVFILPLLTEIIKSLLSSLPLLSADSLWRSSSAPVSSCYARCSVFLLPYTFPVVDSLLIPLLFVCHRQQSGICIVVIINSKQPWTFTFLFDARCSH